LNKVFYTAVVSVQWGSVGFIQAKR